MGISFAIGTTMVVVVFLFVNFCWKRRETPRVEAGDRPGRWANIGLDPAVVETFPVYKYSEVVAYRADMGSLECAVCLSPFEADDDNEELRLLPKCSHVFHVSCVDPWLEHHSTCPLCRTDLVPESDELSLPDSSQVFELGSRDQEVEEVNDHDVLEVRGDLEEGLFEKHKRWKSMGHVAVAVAAEVQWVDKDCWKRFTLNLPEEKMRKHGQKSGKFRRTRYSF